jgi:alpha-L-arabinofuranosidase
VRDSGRRDVRPETLANVAQTINTIHSLFLAQEGKFIVTPNYRVFEMYAAHGGGKSLRTLFTAPDIAATVSARPARLWGLQGFATLHDKQLILTVVNPHHNQPREAEVNVRGASVSSCQSRVLASTDIHAHNTFANPRGLEPTDGEVKAGGQTFVYRFAPASVTRLRMSLV